LLLHRRGFLFYQVVTIAFGFLLGAFHPEFGRPLCPGDRSWRSGSCLQAFVPGRPCGSGLAAQPDTISFTGNPFRAVVKRLTDPATGRSCTVTLTIEPSLQDDRVRVLIDTDPLARNRTWSVALAGAESSNLLASIPLIDPPVEADAKLPYGFYTLTISSGDSPVAGLRFAANPSGYLMRLKPSKISSRKSREANTSAP